MRKLRTAAGILLTSLFLWGCGENKTVGETGTGEISASSVEVQKDGTVVETITEDFSRDYYEEEVLKNMVLSEAADYNKNTQGEDVSIDKFENKDGVVTVVMKYPSVEAYADYNSDAYNEKPMFCGTISQAYDAGYSLDITVTDVKKGETIGKEELLGMGEMHILITEEPATIKVPGKIVYTGDNVSVEGKDSVRLLSDENGESIGKYYVIYK